MPNDHYNYKYNSIRDPLYGFIGLSKEENELIDSKMFGRLRRIKQLSHAYMVYPSAVHTRFEHSLGATHIAGRMCDELQLGKEQKRIVRLAVLLHDIGHGPFSHLFENVLQKINHDELEIHEHISRLIIENDDEIGSILGNDMEKIVDLLSGQHCSNEIENFSLLTQIVSSGLDADKLDYLRRDSYHVGVAYGIFDLERILYTLRKTPDSDSLAVDRKGKDALESYRIGRYLMHTQVYGHHARLAADRMFLQALDAAINEEIIDQDRLKINPAKQFLDFYKTLDDDSIYNLIMNHENNLSQKILEQIKQRRLLKRAIQFKNHEISDPRMRERMIEINQNDLDSQARELAKKLDLESHEVIFYKSNIQLKLFGTLDLLVLDKNRVYSMKEISPISAKDKVVEFYVFGPKNEEKRRRIRQTVVNDCGISLEN